ncbi:MAG: hypothetical protein OHK006_11260 [Thermodesulfovibrionales bacterium]
MTQPRRFRAPAAAWPFITGIWLGLLLLPFKGVAAAAVLAAATPVALITFSSLSARMKTLTASLSSSFNRIDSLIPRDRRSAAVVLAVLAAFPLWAHDYLIDVAVLAGIYVILSLGLNVVVGFTGLLSLGFVAFYAIGAYSYALLNTRLGLGFWTAMPVSVAFAAGSGFVLGFPALRLKGDYLAIVTLGFGEIVRLVLNNWDSFTRGPNGISGIAPPGMGPLSVSTLSSYYYFVLAFVCITVFLMRRIRASRIGRAWFALREDEIASAAMGINATLYKLYAFAFGAFWAGLAGTLFSAKMQFVSPESFTFMESVFILCMVILGGLGSIPGVVIGALILVLLPEMLREVQMYRMLALGCGLVILMIFRPQGLFGGKHASLGR